MFYVLETEPTTKKQRKNGCGSLTLYRGSPPAGAVFLRMLGGGAIPIFKA